MTRKNVQKKKLIGVPCEAVYKLLWKNMSHQNIYRHSAGG